MDESALRSALASLDDCGSSLHWWLELWTYFVVAGVVFEIVFVVLEYVEDWYDCRRCLLRPPVKPNLALFMLGFVGAGLVAVGVSGELNVGAKIATVETCIRKGNDQLSLLLSNEAGDAKKSAEGAQLALSAVQKQAGVISKRLDAASNVLDMLGPRSWLLEKNRAAFIKDLSPRAGQRIIIVSCEMSGPDAPEQDDLRKDLIAFLGPKGAGWAVEPQEATWDECQVPMLSVPSGVGGVVLTLSVAQNAAKDSATASARMLKGTLKKIGITTSIALDTRVNNMPDTAVPGTFWKLVTDDPKTIYLLVGNNALFTLTHSRAK
jgi:hypothetical protein